ncbi:hypothetical protein NGA_0639600, partial [Nannochloropsis gaditana CCMP526]
MEQQGQERKDTRRLA